MVSLGWLFRFGSCFGYFFHYFRSGFNDRLNNFFFNNSRSGSSNFFGSSYGCTRVPQEP